MLSVAAQREAALALGRAIDEARASAGRRRGAVREIKATLSARYDVPQALVHHGLYGRGAPRSARAGARSPTTPARSRGCRCSRNEPTGEVAPVYDVVTGDPAECFLAGGVVVHNCGNKAARTNLRADEIRADLSGIMDSIFSRISFGVGRKNDEPVDHEVLDAIKVADFAPQRQLYDLAAKQLGTVGAGNHYVDLFEDEEGWVWIGVHFGSRGFGHRTASGFLALAEGLPFDGHAKEGEMDSPPVLLPRRLRARAELHRRDAARGRVRVRGSRHGGREGAGDPRRASRPRRSTTTTTSRGASAISAPTCG